MTDSADRPAAALRLIDAANAEDPNTELVAGQPRPSALVYGERMSQRLAQLVPEPSEALRLAARAQHLQRWVIPRERYPEGRKGYHQWRTALARYHAERAGAILLQVGYDEVFVARVQSMLRKERLKLDADVQLLEDVACLVFLEHYFEPFAARHDEAKTVDILRKTWRKMSALGQQAALALPLSASATALVQRALGG
ncbi:MAG: DUF4202 domain-containing protein [Candidatus Lambdaproteobacteria bacterium]|nr:DUF4202 domain-containing protein [Candidatus Lambdaproteobacteria bacterium]